VKFHTSWRGFVRLMTEGLEAVNLLQMWLTAKKKLLRPPSLP
jgi:hypothetical protein